MSIFGSIMSSIFGKQVAVEGTTTVLASASTPSQADATKAASPAAATPAPEASKVGATRGPSAPAATPAPGKSAAAVDVAAILDQLKRSAGEELNWRVSIVDLMKLLKLDSSLSSRKELAKELGYTGSTSDSATMNIWLHKQVMTKLAENGGKVPDNLKH